MDSPRLPTAHFANEDTEPLWGVLTEVWDCGGRARTGTGSPDSQLWPLPCLQVSPVTVTMVWTQ